MIAYRCSNPNCGHLHATDPQGHCPRCKRPDGSGYSAVPVEAVPCEWCEAPRLPDAMFGRCDTCLAAIDYAMGTH